MIRPVSLVLKASTLPFGLNDIPLAISVAAFATTGRPTPMVTAEHRGSKRYQSMISAPMSTLSRSLSRISLGQSFSYWLITDNSGWTESSSSEIASTYGASNPRTGETCSDPGSSSALKTGLWKPSVTTECSSRTVSMVLSL
ncbi:hypothetical protein OGAPHI_007277 [Ogataea philodendri]|uniref:Uncharacterized protein n=1 Tax=Ogataea philodendri TaxID=1378263 RepID=A0A9P8NVM3_9ASCO|nr:uncharacterized protein OGAPHI_007277 [Ogataea philodendri]KAH3660072.1 hypothetical protein OGAPHI_007277 [Ogataea philodendri]